MSPVWMCLVALSCLWLTPNAPAQPPQQATLVEADHGGCYADCPPIPLPTYYLFCFRVGDTFMIGGHESWGFGLRRLASLGGKAFPIRYDQDHLWVKLPSGWDVKLNQYFEDFSFKDDACRAASQRRSLEHGYTRPGPVPGEPATPVMHGKLVSGWALCRGGSTDVLVECTVWDLKGDIRQKGAYEPVAHSDSTQPTSASNEDKDETYRIIHLGNGRVLKLIELPLIDRHP